MNRIHPTDRPEVDAPAPAARVWVLDDPRAGTATQPVGIAERMGVPFRRVPLAWNWMAHIVGLVPQGSLMGLSERSRQGILALNAAEIGVAQSGRIRPFAGDLPVGAPRLVISAGRRSSAVSLWLKARYGCHIVHCMGTGLGGLLRADMFDLLVVPTHDNPPVAPNVLPVLGAPHRISPITLRQAAGTWEERLSHLPHPRIALLVGGPVRGTDMRPSLAHLLGRKVAQIAVARGGSVMATASRRTGSEATEALAAGLGPAMHLLYRWGEPGANPYLGFLATADAIIATADSVSMISEACATVAPVYVALPEMADRRKLRLLNTLYDAGHARPLQGDISAWPRPMLDEAGRVAAEILARFPQE